MYACVLILFDKKQSKKRNTRMFVW